MEALAAAEAAAKANLASAQPDAAAPVPSTENPREKTLAGFRTLDNLPFPSYFLGVAKVKPEPVELRTALKECKVGFCSIGLCSLENRCTRRGCQTEQPSRLYSSG